MSFPKYPAYKDSEVEWIGEIPVGWNLLNGRRLFADKKISARSGDEQLSATQKYGVIPQKDFMKNEDQKVTLAISGIDNFRHVDEGDFVISLRSFQGGIEYSSYNGCVSPAYTVLCRKNKINDIFWSYLFKSRLFIDEINASSEGIRDGKTIRYEQFGKIAFAIPPLPEQQAIARFLDRECRKIDALIVEQERLIALLAEKRQAVISHAVTKGLNPNTPMKDSGIPWIGMVPEGWEVVTAGRVMRVTSGFAFPSDRFLQEGKGVPLLRGVNIGIGKLRWDDVVYWERQINDGLDIYELKEGDIVIGMDRPWISSGLRISQIHKEDLPCLLLQRVGLLRGGDDLNCVFLMYQYSLPNFMHFLAPEMTGVSVPHISPSQIASFPITLPPRKIQDEIIAYLERTTADFENLVSVAAKAITLLKERRAALISAAVTGKIDVRAQSKAIAA